MGPARGCFCLCSLGSGNLSVDFSDSTGPTSLSLPLEAGAPNWMVSIPRSTPPSCPGFVPWLKSKHLTHSEKFLCQYYDNGSGKNTKHAQLKTTRKVLLSFALQQICKNKQYLNLHFLLLKCLLLKELKKKAVKKYVNITKIKRNKCNSGSQRSLGSSKFNDSRETVRNMKVFPDFLCSSNGLLQELSQHSCCLKHFRPKKYQESKTTAL